MKYDQIKRAENGAQIAVIYETSLDFEVIVKTENLTKEEVIEFAHMLLKFVGAYGADPEISRTEAIKEFANAADELRPANCRNRLRDEGKAYCKSGCGRCSNGGLMGCPFEKDKAQ